MKPVDKFGRPIYFKTLEIMYGHERVLLQQGYTESLKKPNLFYRKDGDVIFFADMRGTEMIPIWEDPTPLFYPMFIKELPEWKRNRLTKQELERVGICRESNDLDLDEYNTQGDDGYCIVCGKDFQDDGAFCSEQCGLESERQRLRDNINNSRVCSLCHRHCIDWKENYEAMLTLLPEQKDNITLSLEISHHTNYARDETILVCNSCHTKIHHNDEYNHLQPSDRRPKTVVKQRQCLFCGTSFIPTTSGQRYCSPAHRQKAYEAKHPHKILVPKYDGIPWWMKTKKFTDDDREYARKWHEQHHLIKEGK